MMKGLRRLLYVMILFFVCVSCDKNEEVKYLDTFVYPKVKSDSTSSRNIQSVNGNYTIRKTGFNIINNPTYNGKTLSSQGVAISNDILFRLYDSGICQTYNISDIDNPNLLNIFELGSFSSLNHCNTAQFGSMDLYNKGTPLPLYVAGLRGKCFVEKIWESYSVLVQTISLKQLEVFFNTNHLNIISGDDSNLWIFGSQGDNLIFGKARKPLLSEGDVELSEDDIIDYWYESGYIYSDNAWQGGKFYNGKLYFVFGFPNTHKHIAIYDTMTHSIVEDIILDGFVNEEPEDCEIIGDNILLMTNGGKGYYIISKHKESTGIQSVYQ